MPMHTIGCYSGHIATRDTFRTWYRKMHVHKHISMMKLRTHIVNLWNLHQYIHTGATCATATLSFSKSYTTTGCPVSVKLHTRISATTILTYICSFDGNSYTQHIQWVEATGTPIHLVHASAVHHTILFSYELQHPRAAARRRSWGIRGCS
jgi:hypothetical protein